MLESAHGDAQEGVSALAVVRASSSSSGSPGLLLASLRLTALPSRHHRTFFMPLRLRRLLVSDRKMSASAGGRRDEPPRWR